MVLTVTPSSAAPSLAEQRALWRLSPAYRARPRLVEQAFGLITLLFLTTGLPTEWFVVIESGQYVDSGGVVVVAVFLALTVALLAFSLKRPRVMFYLIVCDLALMAFSTLILFSPLWSADFGTTLRRAVALFMVVLVGIYFVARYSLEQLLNRLSIVFFFSMVVNYVWIFALPQYGVALGSDNWLGITTNRNSLGKQAVLGALIMVFAIRSRNHRILASIGLIGSIGLVLGTNSKTSLVSLVLLAGLLIVFSTFRARRQLFGAVLVSEATAGIVGILVATANLAFITDLLGRDITLTGRTLLWSNLIGPISERPLLGYGWDAFWGGWGSPAHEVWLKNSWLPPTAHNAALEYLLNLGAVGLVFWLVLMGRGLWRSIHYLRDRPGLAGLFPISMISYAALYSVTEHGVIQRGIDWMLLVVAFVETKRFMDRNRSSLDGRQILVERHARSRSAVAGPT